MGAIYGADAKWAQQLLTVPGNWTGRTFRPCGKNWSSVPGRESCTGSEASYRPEGGASNSLMQPVGGHCCDGSPGLGTLLYHGMPQPNFKASTPLKTDEDPSAATASQVVSGHWRVTVLTETLVRVERRTAAAFDDRASFKVANRKLPVVKFTTKHGPSFTSIATAHLGLF